MRVLVYGNTRLAGGEDVRREIESIVPRDNVAFFNTAPTLQVSLQQPENMFSLAVLICASREDLFKIKALSHLMTDVGIILILPGREEDLITLGHSFLPRFLTFVDSDFKEVAEVLRKLVNSRKYMTSN